MKKVAITAAPVQVCGALPPLFVSWYLQNLQKAISMPRRSGAENLERRAL